MTDLATIRALGNDPVGLETLYQEARRTGRVRAFQEAIEACYAAAPDNLLYAAWHVRLAREQGRAQIIPTAWGWAIPLALLNGLLFWLLSDEKRFMLRLTHPFTGMQEDFLPLLFLVAAPLAGMGVLLYLVVSGGGHGRRAGFVGLGLAAGVTYVLWVYPMAGPRPFQEQYLTLMAFHLPLLAWAGVGIYLLMDRRDPVHRFAFLLKSLEIFVLIGLFAGAGGVFTAITVGLFSALDVDLPQWAIRLLWAGGGGAVPILAVAILYDPTRAPGDQPFHEGLSRLISLLMRLLLPLSLLVLIVYLAFIPFRFWEPFENRDVLIIYNAMLFAVMALLVGATPLHAEDVTPTMARWLRRGILAVSGAALVVGLYALAAIIYRTAMDRPTPNRITFIGWGGINVAILAWLWWGQLRAGADRWVEALRRTFQVGMMAYVLWTLVVILGLPWMFTVEKEGVERLPLPVQELVYTQAPPILLKCPTSPHIYLLDGGRKRWIRDIPTFQARGYRWEDVHFIPCQALRTVLDGPPIPPGAGESSQ